MFLRQRVASAVVPLCLLAIKAYSADVQSSRIIRGDGSFSSSVVLGAEGNLYYGSQDNRLHAVSVNGEKLWDYATRGNIEAAPAVSSDGAVIFGSNDGSIYSIRSSGSLSWSYQTGGDVTSTPAVDSDENVFVGSHDGYLYSLTSRGALRWRHHLGTWTSSTPVIGLDGTIYVGSAWNLSLHAINPDGSEKWVFETGHWVTGSAVLGHDGTIYFGSQDDHLYALNPDGSQKWRYKTGGDIVTTPALAGDGSIYTASKDGKLHALDSNGSMKWVFDFEGEGGANTSPVVGADGTIYVGAVDSHLYAVSRGGLIKWASSTDAPVLASPTRGSEAKLYAAATSGSIYSIVDLDQGSSAPDITLHGPQSQEIFEGQDYSDQGAYALTRDAARFVDVEVSGTVDSSTPGTYTLTYTASAANSDASQAYRHVKVIPRKPPTLELLGDEVISLSQNTTYVELGVIAHDIADGDISEKFIVSGHVDEKVLGQYTRSYSVTNSFGQSSPTLTRTVWVLPAQTPWVVLNGDPVVHLEFGQPFDNEGAVARDRKNFTGEMGVSDNSDELNIYMPGKQMVTYTATNALDGVGTAVREVVVGEMQAPWMRLIGEQEIVLEYGQRWDDPGVEVRMNFEGDWQRNPQDGNVVITVEHDIDTETSGVYSVNYKATFPDGKTDMEPLHRSVRVKSREAKLVLDSGIGNSEPHTGADSFHGENAPFKDGGFWGFANQEVIIPFSSEGMDDIAGIQVSYAWDPEIMTLVTETVDGLVVPKLSAVASYASGNPVFDPTHFRHVEGGSLALVWSNEENPSSGNDFADGETLFALHFKLTDLVDQNTSLGVVDGPVKFKVVKGNLIDAQEEVISVGHIDTIVTIANKVAPVITLMGDNPIIHEKGEAFEDPGAEAIDAIEGSMDDHVMVSSGSVDECTLGTYILRYDVNDFYGNAASATREVVVVDTTSPEITLIGDEEVVHPQGFEYVDPGALASDACMEDWAVGPAVPLDVNKLGPQVLTYVALDSSGNVSETLARIVSVEPAIQIKTGSGSGFQSDPFNGLPSVVSVPVTVTGFTGISSFDLSLSWDAGVVTPVTDEDGVLSITGLPQFEIAGEQVSMGANLERTGDGSTGQLSLSWNSPEGLSQGLTLASGAVLLALEFELTGPRGASTTIEIDGADFNAVGVESIFEVYAPERGFVAGTVSIHRSVDLRGNVSMHTGFPLPGAEVHVSNGGIQNDLDAITDDLGNYLIKNILLSENGKYSVAARLRNDEPSDNGVDVSDLVFTRQHIMGERMLGGFEDKNVGDVASWLASDVNVDQSTDVADVVASRYLIQGRKDYFSLVGDEPGDLFGLWPKRIWPKRNDDEQPDELTFKDYESVLPDPARKLYTYSRLEDEEVPAGQKYTWVRDLENVDFVAVKLGDINHDWQALSAPFQQPQGLFIGDASMIDAMRLGQVVRLEDGHLSVPVFADASSSVLGFQAKLSWDPQLLTLNEVRNRQLPRFSSMIHSVSREGQSVIVWDDPALQGVMMDVHEPVVELVFSPLKGVGSLEGVISLDKPVIVDEAGKIGNIRPVAYYMESDGTLNRTNSGIIKRLDVVDGRLRLLVATLEGVNYRVEHANNISTDQWSSLSEIKGTGEWIKVEVSPQAFDGGYYRVVPLSGDLR